ncbi:unnamed protein product [Toxocara canis]|uniref:Uncharacterized protein n=1 Tax=Toxocara canis TaxID=6265 RepID=A0A183UPH7_TOXCA|nr:unnamed protein product [Toxocara canis]
MNERDTQSSTTVPADLLHTIAPLEAFQTETQNKSKRGKAYNNMVRVVPIRGRSEDREKPTSSIMQRSSSISMDGPKPIPPPYTSARTPEAGILLSIGERIRTFINPRKENDAGDDGIVPRKFSNDYLLAEPRTSECNEAQSDKPLREPCKRNAEVAYGANGQCKMNGVRLPPLSSIKSKSIGDIRRRKVSSPEATDFGSNAQRSNE